MPLQRAIPYSEFKDIQKLSTAGAITPVYDSRYEFIKNLILKDTALPQFISESKSSPIRESTVTKDNWLEIAQDFRFRYTLEAQFRAAFVDYLLRALSDTKYLYEECHTTNGNSAVGFVDNVIVFNKHYLPVEVKLDVNLEPDLVGQVSKYCNLTELVLNTKTGKTANLQSLYPGRVLIIDTFRVYMYYDDIQDYQEIFDLWELTQIADISKLRDAINQSLSSSLDLPPIPRERQIRNNILASKLSNNMYLNREAQYRIETKLDFGESEEQTRNNFNDGYYRREQYDIDRYAVNNPDVDMVIEELNALNRNA